MPKVTDANFLEDRHVRKVRLSFLIKTSAKDDDINVGEVRRLRGSGEQQQKTVPLDFAVHLQLQRTNLLKRI